jgi:hypothetical protein
MVDERKAAAGRKGGTNRMKQVKRCVYCGKRPTINPVHPHPCTVAEAAGREQLQSQLNAVVVLVQKLFEAASLEFIGDAAKYYSPQDTVLRVRLGMSAVLRDEAPDIHAALTTASEVKDGE